MNTIPPQQVSLSCPVCGAPIRAQVYSLLDVGLQPELKGKLLRGRINVTHCTNCGSEGVIAAPLLYHDPEHELLLAFIPPEMQLKDNEQQRVIGDLTNMILSYLPPEGRRGYLLVPKVLLSYQSLLEQVLEKEGITPEMMQEQRARMELLERLLQAMENEQDLQVLVEEVDEQLTFEFFATLGAYIEASRQDGYEDGARELEGLREQLLEHSTYGRKLATQMLGKGPRHSSLNRQELLEKLLSAGSEDELTDMVAWYRSAVDYQFFAMLTERMEAEEQAGHREQAHQLRSLREKLLAITERLDEETKVALSQAAGLLRQLLDSDEPESFIRQNLPEFDDAFFIVLGANLQAAEEAGQEKAHQKLQALGQQILEIAQEQLPEVRLLRSLLDAPDDTAVYTLLREHHALVNERLIALMQNLAEAQEEESAAHLNRLAELTERWLEEQD